MVFGIGVMLIVLGALQGIGIGAKSKEYGGLTRESQSDKELAVIGKIIFLVLLIAAGVYLVGI